MKYILALLTIVLALTLSGAHVEASCLTVQFTASGDDDYQGQAAVYDLRVSATPISESNWMLAHSYKHVPLPKPAGTRESIRISGLVAGQKYYFAIRVADEQNNWSALSNVIWKIAPDETCEGMVGNADCDPEDRADLSDILMIASYAFLGGPLPCCYTEANVDRDPNGLIELNDVLLLAQYVYLGGDQLDRCPLGP